MAVFLGTNARNIINGTNAADQIFGDGGNDDLFGLGGADVIFGGLGNDLIKGGLGNDELYGEDDNDTLISGEREPFGTSSSSFTVPNGGNDILDGGFGNDRLIVTFDSRNVRAIGGSGTDTLQMGFDNAALQDFLDLFPPALQTDPSAFTAIIDLTAGTGQYRFNGTTIAVDLTISTIENIDGSAFSETLIGTSGANVINGGDGDDILEGRGGADTLNGGNGRDRASYAGSTAVNVDLDRATQTGGHAQGDRLISIEDITGSGFDDVLRGNAAANIIDGGNGNDTFVFGGGDDTYIGGQGIDTVDFSGAATRIIGVNETDGFTVFFDGSADGVLLSGIESVIGTTFGDSLTNPTDVANFTMALGPGADRYLVRSTGVVILEEIGGGNDIVRTRVNYTLAAGQEIEVLETDNAAQRFSINLTGNEFNNIITGNAGVNVLVGGGGIDTMVGGGDNDTYSVDHERDQVIELNGGGDDRVLSTANYTLPVQVEQLTLAGSTAVAGFGNNLVNRLNGSAGDNLLDGRGGADIMVGQGGHDTFVLRRGETNGDTIFDFLPTGTDNSDLLLFVGYGSFAQGARFLPVSGQPFQFQVTSSDSLVTEAFTLLPGSTIQTPIGFFFADTFQRGVVLDDSVETLIGGETHDAIFGLDGADAILALGGDDVLDGGRDDDIIHGGFGNDSYIFHGTKPGQDSYFDEGGSDQVLFDFSRLIRSFRDGNDLVVEMDLDDGSFRVAGHFNAGNVNQIETARDLTTGNAMVLAAGLVGGDASGIISGTDNGETLDGRGGNDFLYGNGGKDTLLGGEGDDKLDGGKGKDTIVGGNGNDELWGGRGDDTFVFAPGSGHDIVRDFERGEDTIDLTAFDTSFRKLDDDRDGKLDRGDGDHRIDIEIKHGDTIIKFAGGSITIEDVTGLTQHDFMF